MAATARVIAAAGHDSLDAACARVATSFNSDRRGGSSIEAPFDARLLVCGAEAHQLLARAKDAAANGARILAHGPPGGGKSAYVRELGRRMADGGPVRIVGPADFLARAWGATERLVRDLWRRAADDGAILVVDEFEVVGGRRIHGDVSNNALLIRSLTDAWLLALDAFPGVPLLATTNDRAAIDAAVLRRFAFVQTFGDRLTQDQERLAWSVILGEEPPPDWRPSGAAVARLRPRSAKMPDARYPQPDRAGRQHSGGTCVAHSRDPRLATCHCGSQKPQLTSQKEMGKASPARHIFSIGSGG